MTQLPDTCPLCREAGGTIVWQNQQLRVIAIDDPAHPGFTRVIWQAHVAEMTQLTPQARNMLMEAVWLVEQAQRQLLQPDKINLAQFGNMVPHLHWHIIPRWADDSQYPEAIWAPAPARTPEQATAWLQHQADITMKLPQYWRELQKSLQCSNIGITPKS